MAAGVTYTTIATTTLTSAVASYTFSSIPGTYTDIVAVISAQNVSNNGADFYTNFNGDTGTNYSRLYLVGDGTSASSGLGSNSTAINSFSLPSSGSIFNPFIMHINNYSNTTTYKTALIRQSGTTNFMGLTTGTWRNTAAITSITFGYVSNINTGSTFTLYGITAA